MGKAQASSQLWLCLNKEGHYVTLRKVLFFYGQFRANHRVDDIAFHIGFLGAHKQRIPHLLPTRLFTDGDLDALVSR